MRNIILILKEVKTPVGLLFLCVLLASFSSLLSVIPIQFIGFVVSVLSNNIHDSFIERSAMWIITFMDIGSNTANIAFAGIFLFIISTLVSMIFRIIYCYYAEVLFEKVLYGVRKRLYQKILTMDFNYYLSLQKGHVIHTVMSDTQELDSILSRPFYTLFSDFFDLVWISIFIYYVDPMVVVILFCSIPILYFLSIKTALVQKETAENIQQADAELTSNIEQTMSGFETIKAMGGESFEQQGFKDNLSKLFSYRIKAIKSLSIYFPLEGATRAIGLTLVLIYVIKKILINSLQVGLIPVLFDYTNRFYSPIRNIAMYYQTIQRGIASAKRISDFLNNPEEAVRIDSDDNLLVEDQKIIAKNMSLVIDGKTIFNDISFKCTKGDLVLVKGESGSGKTSFLRVLMGLYPIEKSQLFVFGRDISLADISKIRANIVYSGQSVFLHNKSISENILYPNSIASEKELNEILIKLNLDKFQPDFEIKEEGKNISDGEKCRLSFARVLVHTAEIIILDEATSSLDNENTENIIQICSDLKARGKIIFFATHCNNKSLDHLVDYSINFS